MEDCIVSIVSRVQWSDDSGLIQDIYAHNAVNHPDGLCPVETAYLMKDRVGGPHFSPH